MNDEDRMICLKGYDTQKNLSSKT